MALASVALKKNECAPNGSIDKAKGGCSIAGDAVAKVPSVVRTTDKPGQLSVAFGSVRLIVADVQELGAVGIVIETGQVSDGGCMSVTFTMNVQ